MNLNHYNSWNRLREKDTGSSCDYCWCLSFLGFLSPDWSLWKYRNVFSGCTVPPDSKETKLGNWGQEDSPSVGTSTRVVLVSCCTWKCVPTTISSSVNISKVPGCHFLSFVMSTHKNYFKDWCLMKSVYLSDFDLFLIQWNGHIIKKCAYQNNIQSGTSWNHLKGAGTT